MPQKQCARCTKTVYPTEELKCLDKVWHKGCFKCQVCNMTLNMKNYKGYDKLPYCNTHYPQTKFTAVADTPENRRIASNTKIQSNLEYTKDFEASKGKSSLVYDSPAMRTMVRNTENVSMIKYHEEYEKQKGSKIQIADDPEMQRVRQNMSVISNVTYHGEMQKRQEMERARPAEQVEAQSLVRNIKGAGQVRTSGNPPGRIADYDPTEMHGGGGTPYSNRNSAGARQVYDSNVGRVEQPPSRKVGSISDYDPMNDRYGSIVGQPQGHHAPPPAQQQYQPPPPQQMPPQQPPPPQQPAAKSRGRVCVALYDYSAADVDEVSFQEGDHIIECNSIDAGWMEGRVERTGQYGMLPSNYVDDV